MATSSTDAPGPDPRDRHIAALRAALERSERRRAAAEEWADFLEGELEARERRLETVTEQYERQLAAAKETTADRETAEDGLVARLRGLLPGRV